MAGSYLMYRVYVYQLFLPFLMGRNTLHQSCFGTLSTTLVTEYVSDGTLCVHLKGRYLITWGKNPRGS